MASISDLLIAQGNAAANARSQRGNIYADLIRNLSSLPGQVVQQQRATQQDEMRRQMQQQQIDLSKGEQDLQRQRLTQAQAEAQQQQQARERQSSIDAVLGADVYDANGDVDVEKVRTLAAKSDPSIVPHAVAVAQKLNQQTSEWRESQARAEQAQLALASRRNDAIGMAGLELMSGGGDVDQGSYELAIGQFVKHKLVDPSQAEAWLKAETPAERKANVASMIRGSKEATSMLAKPKLTEHDPAKALIDETGKVVVPAEAPVPKASEAETARHNLATEAISRMSAGRAEASAAETARHNRAMEETARNRTTARPVLSGDVNRIADIDTSLNEITALRDEVKGTGTVSYIGAHTPNFITNAFGIGEDAKKRQSQIDRTKQLIGKTFEGGVLRKEDEIKYEKILPTIGDPPDVAARKLDGLERMMKQKRETMLETLDDAGFNVEAMKKRGPAGGAAGPAKSGKVGKYTFTVE
jgi:hypothetical protein